MSIYTQQVNNINDRDVQANFNNMIGDNNNYSISPLVYYEVKRGLTDKKATVKLKALKVLYTDSIKGCMTNKMWEKAVGIWVTLKNQKGG